MTTASTLNYEVVATDINNPGCIASGIVQVIGSGGSWDFDNISPNPACEGDCIDLNVVGNYGNPGFISGFTYGGFYNGSYYYLSDSIDNWFNANSICNSYGGHLATISDSAEQQYIFTNVTDSTQCWLGLFCYQEICRKCLNGVQDRGTIQIILYERL